MKKNIIILIALVKYPSSNNTYITADSYFVGRTIEDLDNAKNDFVSKIETEDFKVINFLLYVVPVRFLLSMGFFQMIWNKVRKPPKTIRCDGGAKG